MNTIVGIAHQLGLTGEAAVPLLLIVVLAWAFYRIVSGEGNPVELWHFFASKNSDGEERGDVNSLGMVAGVVACLFTIIWITYKSNTIDFLVLAVCLVYLGGVKVAATWMRSIADRRFAPQPLPLEPKSIEREITKTTSDKTTTTTEAPRAP